MHMHRCGREMRKNARGLPDELLVMASKTAGDDRWRTSRRGNGRLELESFQVGMMALDPDTTHGGVAT